MLARCLQAQRVASRSSSHLARAFTKHPQLLASVNVKCNLCTVANPEENASKGSNQSEGQQQTPEERAAHQRRARLVSVMIGSAVGFLGGSYILYRKLSNNKAKAEPVSIKENQILDELSQDTEDGSKVDGKDGEGTKKKRHSFKARRVIEYENRIRQYSTPDKVFRYFATLKVVHLGDENDIFMTPEDFVRSLTPGKIQPEGLGLDEFAKFDPEKHKYKGNAVGGFEEGSSVFTKMGDHGLIAFSDYIFLLTVLSLPPRMYEIAFQMFDLNGDGEVSPDEFEKVQNILFSLTATGGRHRDHSTTGSVLAYTVNSGLRVCFFGEDGQDKLTGEKFIEFQKMLQKEVMWLEFLSYEPKDGRITEGQFAYMLLTYSSFHEKKKQVILKRVKKAFKDKGQGVTFNQYLNFFHFLRHLSEADIALSFHNAANKSIDPDTFKRVASTIAGVILDDHVVDIVYKMFDENDDGELSHKEFISVMKNQVVRGLENPKDTGLTKLMSAMWKCAKHKTYQTLHPSSTTAVSDN